MLMLTDVDMMPAIESWRLPDAQFLHALERSCETYICRRDCFKLSTIQAHGFFDNPFGQLLRAACASNSTHSANKVFIHPASET